MSPTKMAHSPSARRSGEVRKSLAQAIFMAVREIATPSETFWPSGMGIVRASPFMIQNSWS